MQRECPRGWGREGGRRRKQRRRRRKQRRRRRMSWWRGRCGGCGRWCGCRRHRRCALLPSLAEVVVKLPGVVRNLDPVPVQLRLLPLPVDRHAQTQPGVQRPVVKLVAEAGAAAARGEFGPLVMRRAMFDHLAPLRAAGSGFGRGRRRRDFLMRWASSRGMKTGRLRRGGR